ncbi:hypothetical protein [Paraburkholderia domus]|uniref:hypothetical protein n=1 Tax=Paraburkholderia domus TaxID=2793075 RepID=UPI00191473C6|nr:hypothetical protein [Paraburkholderia domus]MBK5054181.1 hypothetical protein [Burkholderia sp. R-70006]MBK5064947.1 hypothetical protein [Burkholderia sp. R-70199]MBK5091107.1 hypothetical protein [Burkholderia sp. R-69927]MBK5125070.1 hypothetical protein [Burkholderia sp. R-69980]MBK5168577.1 hypothetical protein [Burkholderia sp. R-70211]MBK5183885.1 hypothetical protein [Burkholderia sp. R-69749]MCI0144282.1 hypothetical protein [Paraburkholderia sediminicola]
MTKLLILLLGGLKLGKILTTTGTMLLSIVVYAIFYGWRFAAGFFLNLFNMIPLSPFDGGRITAVLSPRIWFAGVPVLVGLFAWHPSPLLIVMAILAMPQLKRAWHYDPTSPENVRYYGIAPSVKLTYAFYYLALLAFLAMMTFGIHDMLGPLRGGMR